MKIKDKREATAIALLNNLEIDGFFVAQLRRIENIVEILSDVLEGRIKTSAFQRQNAAYLLGRLGDQSAAPVLVSTLSKDDRSLRLGSLIALAAIGPDADAQRALKTFAESKDTDSVEAAYAREALSSKRRMQQFMPVPDQR